MVLEQRKTILKVLLSSVSSQKNKFTVLEKRKYRNGIFTEMVSTDARSHHQQRPEQICCWPAANAQNQRIIYEWQSIQNKPRY
jgi:hypothetical protein